MIESNIKVKKGLWRVSRMLYQQTAHAIHPNIYVPLHIYKDLEKDEPNPYSISLIKHEQRHIDRQAEQGPLTWWMYYIFSSHFRLNEELLAIQAQMESLQALNAPIDIEQLAAFLSGWMYLKCISYTDAKRILTDMWNS